METKGELERAQDQIAAQLARDMESLNEEHRLSAGQVQAIERLARCRDWFVFLKHPKPHRVSREWDFRSSGMLHFIDSGEAEFDAARAKGVAALEAAYPFAKSPYRAFESDIDLLSNAINAVAIPRAKTISRARGLMIDYELSRYEDFRSLEKLGLAAANYCALRSSKKLRFVLDERPMGLPEDELFLTVTSKKGASAWLPRGQVNDSELMVYATGHGEDAGTRKADWGQVEDLEAAHPFLRFLPMLNDDPASLLWDLFDAAEEGQMRAALLGLRLRKDLKEMLKGALKDSLQIDTRNPKHYDMKGPIYFDVGLQFARAVLPEEQLEPFTEVIAYSFDKNRPKEGWTEIDIALFGASVGLFALSFCIAGPMAVAGLAVLGAAFAVVEIVTVEYPNLMFALTEANASEAEEILRQLDPHLRTIEADRSAGFEWAFFGFSVLLLAFELKAVRTAMRAKPSAKALLKEAVDPEGALGAADLIEEVAETALPKAARDTPQLAPGEALGETMTDGSTKGLDDPLGFSAVDDVVPDGPYIAPPRDRVPDMRRRDTSMNHSGQRGTGTEQSRAARHPLQGKTYDDVRDALGEDPVKAPKYSAPERGTLPAAEAARRTSAGWGGFKPGGRGPVVEPKLDDGKITDPIENLHPALRTLVEQGAKFLRHESTGNLLYHYAHESSAHARRVWQDSSPADGTVQNLINGGFFEGTIGPEDADLFADFAFKPDKFDVGARVVVGLGEIASDVPRVRKLFDPSDDLTPGTSYSTVGKYFELQDRAAKVKALGADGRAAENALRREIDALIEEIGTDILPSDGLSGASVLAQEEVFRKALFRYVRHPSTTRSLRDLLGFGNAHLPLEQLSKYWASLPKPLAKQVVEDGATVWKYWLDPPGDWFGADAVNVGHVVDVVAYYHLVKYIEEELAQRVARGLARETDASKLSKTLRVTFRNCVENVKPELGSLNKKKGRELGKVLSYKDDVSFTEALWTKFAVEQKLGINDQSMVPDALEAIIRDLDEAIDYDSEVLGVWKTLVGI